MDDRLMTARQLGNYLSINERTVLKLAGEGGLPGVRIGNQWRFRKEMIDTWLDDQMLGVAPTSLPEAAPLHARRRLLRLDECFSASHVVSDLRATTKIGVIEELALAASNLDLVKDKTWFVGALIERENVLPTALGNGVAYLHTLRRHPRLISKPFLVLGRSLAGVDFDALDGKPTQLFFVMGLKYEELSLPWMHKLVRMLAGAAVFDGLLAAKDGAAIFDYLKAIEIS